jgi:hypothetical protein
MLAVSGRMWQIENTTEWPMSDSNGPILMGQRSGDRWLHSRLIV